MPRLFTVAQLLSRGRVIADAENDANITDAFLQTMLATVYGTMWGTVVEQGLRHVEKRATLVTAGPNPNVLAIPADHFATVRLDHLDATLRSPVREIMPQELDTYGQPTGSAQRASFFELVAGEILLYPTPPIGQSYELRYQPQVPDLTSVATSTSVDVFTHDGEGYVAWGLATCCRIRQEKDPRDVIREREAALARVATWAQERSFHQQRRPVVEPNDDGLPFRPEAMSLYWGR